MEELTNTLVNSLNDIAFGIVKSLLGGAAIGFAAAIIIMFSLNMVSRLVTHIPGKSIAKISSTVFMLITAITFLMIYFNTYAPGGN